MDPLSITASIIAVTQLTSEVIKYLIDVKDAPKECQRCVVEASNLWVLLTNLRCRLEGVSADDAWFTSLRGLNAAGGVIDQYKAALEQLKSRVVVSDGMQKFKTRLEWKFSKAEVEQIFKRFERLISLVQVALEMDHFKLSQAMKEDISSIKTTTLEIHRAQQAQSSALHQHQHQQLLDWLSPLNYSTKRTDIESRRQPDTGEWFLRSAQFVVWVRGVHDTLLCPGIPGAGKTMMVAIAIDHLSSLQRKNGSNIGLAYVFCDFRSQLNQNADGLLAALLKQLIYTKLDVSNEVRRTFDWHEGGERRPSLDEIIKVLVMVCKSFDCVYVLVDALDECSDNNRDRSHLIDGLRRVQTEVQGKVKLMFTCRFIPEIIDSVQADSTLEIRASKEDVRLYIEGQMPRLPRCIQHSQDLQKAVCEEIIDAVDGMFLLARLHVDSLLDKMTKRAVVDTLSTLRGGSEALNQAYDDVLKRIDGQLAGRQQLAKIALSWMTYARRPLKVEELCQALAVKKGSTAMDADAIHDIDDVLAVCAGLIVVDEQSQVVRLVHYTTQEYLERVRAQWLPEAEIRLAEACLTYLAYDVFRSGSCGSDREYEQRLADHPLFDYCGRHWGEHVRAVQTRVLEQTLEFLQCSELMDGVTQAEKAFYSKSQYFPHRMTALHVAAREGLHEAVKKLMATSTKSELNAQDSFNFTPLWWAFKHHDWEVVQLFVRNKHVDVNLRKFGDTPLRVAIMDGLDPAVKILVEREDLDFEEDDYERSPICWAAVQGSEEILNSLLEWGPSNVNWKAWVSQTALRTAAYDGHEDIARIVIKRKDIDVNFQDDVTRFTPLILAATQGHEGIVRLLLGRHDIDVNLKDVFGETALSRAKTGGFDGIVKLLIDRGVKS